MKVGDLAKVKVWGWEDEYCLITAINKDPKCVNLQIELYLFIKGIPLKNGTVQRHMCISSQHVEVINETR